jgi:hypothetical protein
MSSIILSTVEMVKERAVSENREMHEQLTSRSGSKITKSSSLSECRNSTTPAFSATHASFGE